MINLATLTTVYERPLITYFHFKWMEHFKVVCWDIGIDLQPLYVLSEDDSHLNSFRKELERRHINYTIRGERRLSYKSQGGLEYLKNLYDPDWLMHLDSDEILSEQLMKRWKKEFEEGTKWFGASSCYFGEVGSGTFWEFEGYEDHPVKNGGTCLHREILESTDWTLWPIGRQTGLNIMERRHIEKHGYNIKPIDMQREYGVVEIKGGNKSIHGLDWFKKRGLIERLNDIAVEELLSHHPLLRLLV